MTSDREANLLQVLTHTSRRFYVWIAMLSAVALWGFYGYITQLRRGLIVTGLSDQISWGLYISNFVFFTGISYGGTLISAILRVTGTGWRHPITRLSEAITVFALSVGAPMVIIDMGRPERMMYLFTHGRLQSVILWDVIAISTYLAGCVLYLYLPMIPDLALLSKRQDLAAWRRKLYRTLSFGWTGSPAEQEVLEKCISRMAVFMIMLAVSVHTVVSWIFAMTLRPGWNSSIFGPYFVMAAIYSGTAAVVLSMYILRRVLHLADYLKPIHFRYLGILLYTFALLYLYFNINEYLTVGYKVEGSERLLVHQLFFGDFAVLLWVTILTCLIIPLIIMTAILALKRLRKFTPGAIAMASILIILGAGAKRFLIVVPTLSASYLQSKDLPIELMHYRPTWVEWSITFGATAVLVLMYMLFTKIFPIVSIWETRQDEVQAESAEAAIPQAASSRLGSTAATGFLLIAFLFLGTGSARAAEESVAPEPTTLSMEYEQVENPAAEGDETQQTQPGGVEQPSWLNSFFGRLLGWTPTKSGDQVQNPPSIQITATLLDSNGQPIPWQVIGLSLKTSFGKLNYGNRPTNPQGKAQFVIKDRRYGQYPVEASYNGGDEYAAARIVASVDFGTRPPPSLPSEGVLIDPYSTPIIGIPFTAFFGYAWFVFIYVGIYLLFLKLPRVRRNNPAKETTNATPDEAGAFSEG